MEAEDWEEAQRLAAQHPELSRAVCLPWADWLLSRGSFQQARLAYRSLPKDCCFKFCLEKVMSKHMCLYSGWTTYKSLPENCCFKLF